MKPLVFLFYALGDYIIVFAIVPAAIAFGIGHLLFISNRRYFKMTPKEVLTSIALTVPIPVMLWVFNLLEAKLMWAMIIYISTVAVIFVKTMKDATASKPLKFGAFMFYVSDCLLCMRQYAAPHFGS